MFDAAAPPPTASGRELIPTNTSDDVFLSPAHTSGAGRSRASTAGEDGGEGREERRGLSVAEEFDRIAPTSALQHVC